MDGWSLHCTYCGAETPWPAMTCSPCSVFAGVVGWVVPAWEYPALYVVGLYVPVGAGTFIDREQRVGLNHHHFHLWSVSVDLRTTPSPTPSPSTKGKTA